ncbi:hypothetical protein GCM10027057_15640 [Marisediminicola antarctica]
MAGTAVATGAALGGGYAIALLTREQLLLPSGPSFALLPVAGIVGAAVGALVAAAGAAGGAAAILLTRSRSLGPASRAAITGSAAGTAALAAAAALFLHPWVIDGGSLVIGSAIATGILTAAGTRLSERRQAGTSGAGATTPTPYD